MGQLTAGIAHELNNPMMGILNYTQYCLKHTTEDDHRYTALQDSLKELNRCIKIVKDLLAVSHKDSEEKENHEKEDFNTILERVLKLLSYRIQEEHVDIKQHISKELSKKIDIKTNTIQQVFLNLLSNALDALHDSKKKEINIDLHKEGKSVHMVIADTGCGIPQEKLHKIFEPFFTTKPIGKGTGLGLNICKNIIKTHGGEISCESEVGKGTKFKIELPIERIK